MFVNNIIFGAMVLVGIIMITFMIGLICNEKNLFVCTAQNSPRMYLTMSVSEFFFGDRISARDDNNPLSDPPAPPNWPYQLQTPSCGPECNVAQFGLTVFTLTYICEQTYSNQYRPENA